MRVLQTTLEQVTWSVGQCWTPFLWDKLRVNDADTDSTRAASTGANLALIAASLHCCHPSSSSSSSAGVACCPDKGQAKVLRALDAI